MWGNGGWLQDKSGWLPAPVTGGGGGGSPPLDGLSPTGAWSPSRKLLTGYGGSFYALTSGEVSTLYDQSGNARNFVVTGSGATKPDLDTSTVAALSYNGVADWMQVNIAMSNFITATDAYVICSFKATGFNSNQTPIIQDGSQNLGQTTRSNSGSPLLASTNWGGGQSVQHSIVANTAYVVETRHQGGVLYQRLNGSNEQSVSSGNTTLAGSLNLGGRLLGTSFQGLIYEVAIFSTVPTLTQRDALVQAFGTYIGASV
ncbi:hypothetical protein [Bradyrhizobium sp. USDA 3458]|uniref:hypothetical protein n=1 Tax=Bradyrhizobium sp. USDA 3458 TaxID=2591461 RepID=UPI00114501C6|nr:hypothetical protein [Bradyrhizobium sp. USDA 3458]